MTAVNEYGCIHSIASINSISYSIDLAPVVVDKDGVYKCYQNAAQGFFLEIPWCTHGIPNMNCAPFGYRAASIANGLIPTTTIAASAAKKVLRLEAASAPINIGSFTDYIPSVLTSDPLTFSFKINYKSGALCPDAVSLRQTTVQIQCGTVNSQLLTTADNCAYTFNITTTDQSICASLKPGMYVYNAY